MTGGATRVAMAADLDTWLAMEVDWEAASAAAEAFLPLAKDPLADVFFLRSPLSPEGVTRWVRPPITPRQFTIKIKMIFVGNDNFYSH